MNKAEAGQVVCATGWLSRRPEAFRTELIARCRLRVFEPGASVYGAGDPSAGMFGLADGRLLMRVPPVDAIITVEAPGFWCGEAAAFRHGARMATISAASRSYVLHLPQSEFDSLILDAENCRHIAINTAEALGEAIGMVASLTQAIPEVRVAQRLLTYVGLYGETRRNAMAVSQADFAIMCGLSRQTMSRVLGGLVDRNMVALAYRRIEVLDIGALRQLAIGNPRAWR